MADTWFVRKGGKVFGPFSQTQLRSLASTQKISADTEVATSAHGPWHLATKVRGLLPNTGLTPPLPRTPAGDAKGFPVAGPAHAGPRPRGMPPSLPPAPAAIGATTGGSVATAGTPSASATAQPAGVPKSNKTLISTVFGSLFAIAIVTYNVGTMFYNGYLQTDTAAIGLIQQSMQETFETNPDLAKPVRVYGVQLNPGRGDHRTGKATIEAGGASESISFRVKITKSLATGVEVQWETIPGS